MLYVLCGIPASGKTTLSKQLAEQHNAVVHSYDDMPNENTRASMDGSVKRAWFQAIHTDLEQGKSVVCDNLNLMIADRKELLSYMADISCEKILVVKETPLEICLQRNKEREARLPDFVIEQASEKFETPSFDEGWDDMLYID